MIFQNDAWDLSGGTGDWKLQAKAISASTRIANPGCYPTGPLAKLMRSYACLPCLPPAETLLGFVSTGRTIQETQNTGFNLPHQACGNTS